MRRRIVTGIAGFLAWLVLSCAVEKGRLVDDYHGTAVEDPYRALEDPDSPGTRAWIEEQNRRTFAYLDAIPEREKLKQRLTSLWNYEKHGIPSREGNRYFFTKNDGLQNQAVLYVADTLAGEPRLLLDPNKLSSDGTVSLNEYEVSEDGSLLAYGVSASGSDWQEWRVRDVRTGEDLPDRLRWIKFSGAAWTRDSKGFFYSRYAEPVEATQFSAVNYNQKLYYHRIGSPQSDDALIHEQPDEKEWAFDGTTTHDGRYLVVIVRKGTDPRKQVFFKELGVPGGKVERLISGFDAAYSFVGSDGPTFWLLTDSGAPRGRLVAVDAKAPSAAGANVPAREIIPQSAETLLGVRVVGGRFIASYLKDAKSVVRLFRPDGTLERELPLPGIGTVSGFTGKPGDEETFFSFAGFTAPVVIYRLDFKTGNSEELRRPRLAFRPEDYETEQVFYRSKDGTRIPMCITRRKGLALTGDLPALLYGYGGFNISITPSFSVMGLVWMEMGGVYAVPNLRGGGEYGEDWHKAGTKLLKQNVFDDFIAAAEWLISNHYTSPGRLAIHGRSNGGLLVGACLTQRPDLFGATLPAVGVMDMLRYQKFTIGWAWVSDYGSSENREEFRALYAYSPLHNIRRGTKYPATLVTTADHDDRVVPAHSFKFAATLDAAQAGPAPILIRIDTKAGHGAGKPTSKAIEEMADQLGFLVRELHVQLPE